MADGEKGNGHGRQAGKDQTAAERAGEGGEKTRERQFSPDRGNEWK